MFTCACIEQVFLIHIAKHCPTANVLDFCKTLGHAESTHKKSILKHPTDRKRLKSRKESENSCRPCFYKTTGLWWRAAPAHRGRSDRAPSAGQGGKRRRCEGRPLAGRAAARRGALLPSAGVLGLPALRPAPAAPRRCRVPEGLFGQGRWRPSRDKPTSGCTERTGAAASAWRRHDDIWHWVSSGLVCWFRAARRFATIIPILLCLVLVFAGEVFFRGT